jgi:hypothetical protein
MTPMPAVEVGAAGLRFLVVGRPEESALPLSADLFKDPGM